MAEISVPAWPIPIHHTKFTMANPQATGMFTPQIPIPRIRQPRDREQQRDVPMNVGAERDDHWTRSMRRKDKRAEILSVTQ